MLSNIVKQDRDYGRIPPYILHSTYARRNIENVAIIPKTIRGIEHCSSSSASRAVPVSSSLLPDLTLPLSVGKLPLGLVSGGRMIAGVSSRSFAPSVYRNPASANPLNTVPERPGMNGIPVPKPWGENDENGGTATFGACQMIPPPKVTEVPALHCEVFNVQFALHESVPPPENPCALQLCPFSSAPSHSSPDSIVPFEQVAGGPTVTVSVVESPDADHEINKKLNPRNEARNNKVRLARGGGDSLKRSHIGFIRSCYGRSLFSHISEKSG